MTRNKAEQTTAIERCPWPGIADPLYARYHDTEWGVPLTSVRALFEKLVLLAVNLGYRRLYKR